MDRRSCASAALRFVQARAVPGPPLDPGARVCLHFHPDYLASNGQTARSSMLREGTYLSQFATGTSNGGLTARAGGDRARWERRLFGGAYDESPPSDRPVYGALTVTPEPYGPAPRFGSCYSG